MVYSLSSRLGKEFGLDGSEQWKLLEELVPPPSPPMGKVANSTSLQQVMEALGVGPAAESSGSGALPETQTVVSTALTGLAEVRVLADWPGFFLVAVSRGEVFPAGAWEKHPDGFYVLDSSKQAALRIRSEQRDVVVLVEGEEWVVLENVAPLERASKQRWPEGQSSRPEIVLPSSAPRWLRDEVSNKLGSDQPFDWAVAAGMIYQHAPAAVLDTARQKTLQQLLAAPSPDQPLRQQAEKWMSSLTSAQRKVLGEMLVARAALLAVNLHGAPEQAVQLDEEHVSRLIVGYLHERDELEGLARLMSAVESSLSFSADLERVDEVGTSQLSFLGSVQGLEEDERLRAVAWQMPEAWWGNLAVRSR